MVRKQWAPDVEAQILIACKRIRALFFYFHQDHTRECKRNAFFECILPKGIPLFDLGGPETEWCKQAKLETKTGSTRDARALAQSAARYYAYMRCRRFLDFSTSQSEFVSALCVLTAAG